MIRALYTATSGMLVEAHKLDLTARNLYFAQTPGYKAMRVLRAARQPTAPAVPSDVQTILGGEYLDPSEGPMRPTGRPLDLAIQGQGFFAVQTPAGVGYTRDGRFRTTKDGLVANSSDYALLGEKGPIRIPGGARFDAEIQVDQDGTFRVDGKIADRIVLSHFPGYRGLQAAGGSLFYPVGAVAPQRADAAIVQGTLEGSNASAVAEMTRTIDTVRSFESYQKVIQTVMEDVTGQAVRRIGRVA